MNQVAFIKYFEVFGIWLLSKMHISCHNIEYYNPYNDSRLYLNTWTNRCSFLSPYGWKPWCDTLPRWPSCQKVILFHHNSL